MSIKLSRLCSSATRVKSLNSSFQNHLKAFDALFWSLADDDGLVIKSTRHTADTLYNNRLSPALVTPSTILVHGLLGEVCLEDSDCSILNSVCSDSQRCACQPGTQPFDEGKICKFSSVDTNVPPTVLVGKPQCLKIIEKVAFNIASEASYINTF